MLPLRRQKDIDIRINAAVMPYVPGAGVSSALSLYPLAAAIAAGNRLTGLADWWAGTAEEPHFTVALLPSGALGAGVEGVNMKVFRRALFVTEDKFKATLHELGHAGPGLYTGTEQYDLAENRAEGGKLIEGTTAFINEPDSTLDIGSPGRLLHLPRPWYAWKAPVKLLDIMGAGEPSWIDPDTLTSFRHWLSGLLGSAPAAASGRVAPIALMSAPGPGIRRVFLSMRSIKHPAATRHLPDLGTVRLLDTTPFARRPAGVLRDPAYSDYHVVAFDAAGRTVFLSGFTIADEYSLTQPPPAEEYSWSATCDLPDSAVRIVVRPQREPDILYFDHTRQPGMSAELLQPVAGTLLEDAVTVRWQAAPDTVVPLRSQPLQHLVLVSHNGGETWEAVTGQIEGSAVTLSTLGWPAGSGKALRLLTSDGFRTVEAQVNHLTVPNRAPRVEIVAPGEADRAIAGHGWSLRARVNDPDGDEITAGSWTSSRDGVLGAGRAIEAIRLSPGTHILTYAVTDSSGLTGRGSVRVEVAASNGLPIPLTDDALVVIHPGRDRHEQAWVPLRVAEVHRADLTVRVPGEAATLRLCLFLTPPNRGEMMLRETIADVPPFARVSVESAFRPGTHGLYRFRATVERGVPEGAEAGWTWILDKERTWECSTRTRSVISVVTQGQGEVVMAPDGIVCSSPFTGDFDRGRLLLLLAVPSPGWRLDGWEGVDAVGLNTGRFVVSDARAVRVRFVPGESSSTGSLRVRLREAMTGGAGMEWRILGTTDWMVADSIRTGLPAGSYLLEFRGVPGFPNVPVHPIEIPGGGAVIHEHVVPALTVETVNKPPEGGTVTGDGSHLPGGVVVLRAHPATNHLFEGWMEGGLLVWAGETLAFDAVRHRQLFAHFARSLAISTIADLQRIGVDPAYPADAVYHLAGSIDASASRDWDGGRGFRPIADFTGTFDGRGHTLCGLHIDRPGMENVGLFGQNSGIIVRLVLDQGSIRGGASVGGLVGSNIGWVEDCEANLEVTGTLNVGGLVGRNRATMRTVQRCAAMGPVTGDFAVGGLVGAHELGAEVADCFATGPVHGGERVGGLIGRVHEASVTRCYSSGPVIGTLRVGGLIGSTFFDDLVSASFWDMLTSGISTSARGVGKTTFELRQRGTFVSAGWDFDVVWGIAEGEAYPYLRRAWNDPSDPTDPLKIAGFGVDDGLPNLLVLTEVGRAYVLEESSDLVHWVETRTWTATLDETRLQGLYPGPWGALDQRFYRVRTANP